MKKTRNVVIAGLFAVQLAGAQAASNLNANTQGPSDEFYMAPSTRMAQPRIAPLPEAEVDGKAAALLDAIGAEGKALNLFTTMARHPELMEKWLPFAEQVLRASTLPARDREIIVLRMGWLSQSDYEFAHHVAIGKKVGLNDADIRRVTEGSNAAGLLPLDALLIRAVDELDGNSFISDQTWKALSETYNTQQMIDLVFLAGHYKLVSMMLNSLGVQVEDGYKDFLKKP